jgi:hypothetical protein
VPTSTTAGLVSSGDDSQPANDGHNDAVPLNTFLDLNPSANVPQEAGAQRPVSDLPAAGARSSPSDGDAAADGLLSEADVEESEAQSSEERGPGTPPRLGQAEEVVAAAPPESRADSADERAANKERVETRDGRGWTSLVSFVLAVSIPVVWACWRTGSSLVERHLGPVDRSGSTG